jgi:lipid A disaccharide synthetase
MVVLYRMSLLNWGILSLLRRCGSVKALYGAVPNLLGEAPIYPELLQHQARGDAGVALLGAYEGSPDLRLHLHERMKAARKRLGVPGAFHLWARKTLEYLLP